MAEQHAELEARASVELQRILALEKLHRRLRRLLLRRATRGAPRGPAWERIEQWVAGVPGKPLRRAR